MYTNNINAIVKLQARRAVNLGIDMGDSGWVMTARSYIDGSKRLYRFSGLEHDNDCYAKISELVQSGCDVNTVYEAGRYGFTPARIIQETCGASVTVLPLNKLEVVQSGKKVKTDRLDSDFLSGLDSRVMKVPSVWIPEIDQECRRTMLREKKRIERDMGRNNNRILSILKRWPEKSDGGHRGSSEWHKLLMAWKKRGKCMVPAQERKVIINMINELATLEQNLTRWENELQKEEKNQREQASAKGESAIFDILRQYTGISIEISRAFAWYIGDFKRFANAKKFTSYLGLTPTPYSSGKMNREQGISKKGNRELRRLVIQMAWLWRRWQPQSALAKKWENRLKEKGRSRKTAIVALARQICVALYRLLVYGEELEGAVKNQSLPCHSGPILDG